MILSFLKNSSIYGIGKGIGLFLGFLTIPIITQHISPTEYGIFDLLSLCLVLLNLFVALEVSQAVARFIADTKNTQENRVYTSTAYYFSLLSFAFVGILIFIFKDTLAGWLLNTEQQSHLITYLIPWLFLQGSLNFIFNQLRWENKPIEHTCLHVLKGLTLLSVVYLTFVVFNKQNIETLIKCYLYALLVANIGGLILFKKDRLIGFNFSISKLKAMLYFSAPLVPSSLAVFGQIYTDRIMISQMVGLEDLGLYGLAFRVVGLLIVFSSIFQMAVVPLLYKHYQDPKASHNFGLSSRIYLFFMISAILGLTLFIKDFFHFFIGSEFYDAQHYIPYLLVAVLFSSFYVFAPGLAIRKKTQSIALINIAGLGINFILNLILISWLSTLGAAIATLLSGIIICIIHIVYSQKSYYIEFNFGKIISALILLLAGLWVANQYVEAFEITITTIFLRICITLGFATCLAFILLPQEVIKTYRMLANK